MSGNGRAIVFLSDFGYRNEWVGICHAVMSRIAPTSPIIDLSHGVPPLDVQNGALLLVDSVSYVADDAVLLAVVDPSVGRHREVAIESNDGRVLVGPDNGLLMPAAAALGGVARAVEITSPDVVLLPISPSFHARDVLAPAAAHLAAGVALDALGPAVDADSLARITIPEPTVETREDRMRGARHQPLRQRAAERPRLRSGRVRPGQGRRPFRSTPPPGRPRRAGRPPTRTWPRGTGA